jgi:tRNA/tmRNA/rRNA uracil-C5-methylase (TrmA/RlmC/RlmD family)
MILRIAIATPPSIMELPQIHRPAAQIHRSHKPASKCCKLPHIHTPQQRATHERVVREDAERLRQGAWTPLLEDPSRGTRLVG